MMIPEKIGTNVIKLWQLSKKTRIPQQIIVDTVLSAGFVIPKNNPNISLNSNQVEIVALTFVDSVTNYYEKVALSYNELPQEDIFKFKNTFSHFIKNSHELSLEDFFNSEIDDELIKHFFYTIIYSESNSENISGLYYVLSQLKYKINKVVKDKRVCMFSFVISNSNHIYPDEEDEHNSLAIINNCFSVMLNIFREALIKLLIYKKQFSWIKYKYLLSI